LIKNNYIFPKTMLGKKATCPTDYR